MNHIKNETKLGRGFLSSKTSASRTDRGGPRGPCAVSSARGPSRQPASGTDAPRGPPSARSRAAAGACADRSLRRQLRCPAGQGRPRGRSAPAPARATPRAETMSEELPGTDSKQCLRDKTRKAGRGGRGKLRPRPAQRGQRGPPHLPGGCQPHPARSSGPSQGSQPPEEHGSGETLGALPCTSPPACLPREPHDRGRCDGQQPAEGQPRPASRRKPALHSTVTAGRASQVPGKAPVTAHGV